MQKDTVAVLSSGGVVSLNLLNFCEKNHSKVIPMYIQSGFRWEEAEIYSLKKFLRSWKKIDLDALEVVMLPLRDTFQMHWSVTGVKVPNAKSELKDIYLPGRDVMLLTKGTLFSALHGISKIYVGFTKAYADVNNTKDTMIKVQDLISQVVGRPILIEVPYIDKNTEDVLFDGRDINIETSFSCLMPKGYSHCGDCYKCHLRREAFFKTGITDKTQYYKSLSLSSV